MCDEEVLYEDSDQRLGGHDQPYDDECPPIELDEPNYDEPEGAGEDCFERALWNANPLQGESF